MKGYMLLEDISSAMTQPVKTAVIGEASREHAHVK